jgi:hypothetical protein
MEIEINSDDGDDRDDEPTRTDRLVAWLSRRWEGFKKVMRAYGWFIVSGVGVVIYFGMIVTGRHTASKAEKIMWLALPSGAFLMAPGTIYAVLKLWRERWHFYDKVRGDDSDSPREVWKANEAAHARITSERHQPNRVPGTLNPTFEVMEIEEDSYTVTPTYRGKLSPDALRRNRENIGMLWDEVDSESRMWRAMRDYMPAIIRKLDRDRAIRQAQAVEEHTIPNLGGGTVEDTIRETIPDELLSDEFRERGDRDEETEDMVDEALDQIETTNGRDGDHE